MSGRAAGILLPVFSLPSRYGIGTLGREARRFADFLAEAGQKYWQILPMGPTSFGDSPYQSFSSFAGNPYFIDPELLIEDGLLTEEETERFDWGSDPQRIDYEKLYQGRFPLLELARERGWERDREAVDAFVRDNEAWLKPYARFMALKRRNGMAAWTQWTRDDAAPEDEELFIYIQYLFFRQWNDLRAYLKDIGISVIGDIPIYVAMDSADVWSEPELFRLDEAHAPLEVAGVPPDYFCEDGQLWGNPLYDYEKMKADGYGWWIRRVAGAARLYDVIRIDHFRGFESYWAVPFGEKTARNGKWVPGPGMDLVGTLTSWFRDLRFIAEDLGVHTDALSRFLEESGLPGMKVLEFAFEGEEPSDYLPYRYDHNCVCYTGTHDNAPLGTWIEGASPRELALARDYIGGRPDESFARSVIRAGMNSTADLFVAQLQDWLELGEESRVNTPGTLGGNWQWRLRPEQLRPGLAEEIRHMTRLYGR